MKYIITLSLITFAYFSWAQDSIKIVERNEKFSVGIQNALVSNVPLGDKDFVEDLLKDAVKKFKGKVNHKEEFFIEQADKTTIMDKPIDVYVRILLLAGGKIELAWAFNLGGAYLNKKEHPDMYRKAEKKIYDVVKNISTKYVDKEVEEEEDKLKDLEKELDKMQKDKEKLEKDIEKSQEDIKEYKNEIKLNEASQDGTKTEIETLHAHENIDQDALTDKNKELEKLIKDKENLQKKIEKEEENISKARDDIKKNESDQDAKKKEIEEKKKYIEEEVKSKYAKIK